MNADYSGLSTGLPRYTNLGPRNSMGSRFRDNAPPSNPIPAPKTYDAGAAFDICLTQNPNIYSGACDENVLASCCNALSVDNGSCQAMAHSYCRPAGFGMVNRATKKMSLPFPIPFLGDSSNCSCAIYIIVIIILVLFMFMG